jgi:hypothetical protein
MIDAVAKALALWAVPFNDWDALTEEQRERWREGAKATMGAMRDPVWEKVRAAQDSYRVLADQEYGIEYDEISNITYAAIRSSLTPADG